MDAFHSHERFRGVVADGLPRWFPALAAAVTVAVAAATVFLAPSAIAPPVAALVLNGLLAAGGSSAAAYLRDEPVGRTVAAAIGLGVLGLVRYVGYSCGFLVLVCAAVAAYAVPEFRGVAAALCVVVAIVRQAAK